MSENSFIVFDTETNGVDPTTSSLLAIAAKKFIFDDLLIIQEIDSFQRFYYPIEPYNSKAIKVNGLTEERIKLLRTERYPKYFRDDNSFIHWCRDIENYVGHNIQFDLKFVSSLSSKKIFDTMLSNVDIIKCEWNEKTNSWKWPTLGEAAKYYNIPFKNEDAHDAMFDVSITAEIFKKMLIFGKI
jgi:DNA polymerase-3 subunit epsilon